MLSNKIVGSVTVVVGLNYQASPLTECCAFLLEVNVILRLTHLPPFPEYKLDLCSFPRGYGPLRPVSMEGLVIAMTRVTKYTQGARFLCVNEDCPSATGTAVLSQPIRTGHS